MKKWIQGFLKAKTDFRSKEAYERNRVCLHELANSNLAQYQSQGYDPQSQYQLLLYFESNTLEKLQDLQKTLEADQYIHLQTIQEDEHTYQMNMLSPALPFETGPIQKWTLDLSEKAASKDVLWLGWSPESTDNQPLNSLYVQH